MPFIPVKFFVLTSACFSNVVFPALTGVFLLRPQIYRIAKKGRKQLFPNSLVIHSNQFYVENFLKSRPENKLFAVADKKIPSCKNSVGELNTDLEQIAALAEAGEDELHDFRLFLKRQDKEAIDERVHRLNDEISSRIDCTNCGNCCKTLMVGILPEERPFFAAHFKLSSQEAGEQYLATGASGDTIMSNMPCVFLCENKCTVYENRFTDCREFPHLHKKNFTGRLFSVMNSYGRCPFVFNVVEALKKETGFSE